MGPIWIDYVNGKATIDDVIEEYKRNGFDGNQDVPGNFMWEELYRGMGKETKVILTIRDSDEKWFQSLYDFTDVCMRQNAIGGINLTG